MANFSALLLSVLLFQLVSGGGNEWVNRLVCGGRTTASTSFVIGSDEFSPESETNCVYQIIPHSLDVRQLRIRLGFNMAQPSNWANSTYTPECNIDYIEIAGTRYCGYEGDQHIYVPFGPSAGVSQIRIRLVLAPRLRKFDSANYPYFFVMIEQLIVGDSRLAPPGCMQYYLEEKGVITSFNYHHGLGSYPAGLNYTICVRHPPGGWALRLKFLDFHLNDYVSNTTRGLETRQHCSDGDWHDHLSIPSSIVEPVAAADFLNVKNNRFCGSEIYNKTVISEDNSSLDTFFQMHFESKYFLTQTTRAGFLLEYEVLYERDANNLYP